MTDMTDSDAPRNGTPLWVLSLYLIPLAFIMAFFIQIGEYKARQVNALIAMPAAEIVKMARMSGNHLVIAQGGLVKTHITCGDADHAPVASRQLTFDEIARLQEGCDMARQALASGKAPGSKPGH